MTRLSSWFLLLLAAGAFVGAVWYALATQLDAGKGMPAYSVYSEEANGLAPFARWLRAVPPGYEPVALTRPVGQLRPGKPRLLILVEPSSPGALTADNGMSEPDALGLLRWVEQGNTLLLCGRTNTPLHSELGISLRGDTVPGEESAHDVVLGEAGRYTDDVDSVAVEGNDTLQADAGLPLWWSGDQVGAVAVRRGKGRVIMVADPSLLTLRGLHRRDNARFVYNIVALHARDGHVYFDEYHHGLRSGGGVWGYLHYKHEQWLLVPLTAAALVLCWSWAVRLGPGVPQPGKRGADAVAYASALARIYERAGVRHLLAKGVARGFVTALARHLKLRPTAPLAEMIREWRQRMPGASSGQLEGLLRGVGELRRGDVSERGLLAWTRRFDEFLKTVSPLAASRDPAKPQVAKVATR